MKQNTVVFFLFLLVLCINSSLGTKSKEKGVESDDDVMEFLTRFGYNPCGKKTSRVLCTISKTSLIQEYQERFGLKVTGQADQATKRHMNKPRCGNEDRHVRKSNAPKALENIRKWSNSSLTWAIRSFPTQISEARTTSIIWQAFRAWLEHIPLSITQTCSQCPANIVIEFVAGDHDDGFPFHGIGRTLAHAYSPEDGRIHFDADEDWTESLTSSGSYLYSVAVHEIGHALGLDHIEENITTVMYPSYEGMAKTFEVPLFDVATIQKLYGHTPTTTTTTTTAAAAATAATRTTATTTSTTISTRSNVPKWSRSSLTWSLRSFPKKISESRTASIIQRAFNVWLQYIPLNITETCATCTADIIIEFISGDHRDGFPFDGPGGTLVHTFFPEDGRMHLDADENWIEGVDDSGKNLFSVVLHEIGHVLGLAHSYDEKSIMFPLYETRLNETELPDVDREAIQQLYGSVYRPRVFAKTTSTTQTTKTTATTATRVKNAAKWSRSALTWSIHSFPKQLTEERTMAIFRLAFATWFEHIPITITETCSKCSADIVIEFVRGEHGDGYSFDGSGGTSAHAFSPEDGRMHFDADEEWTEGFQANGMNLYAVAVHTIGHVLGLPHSERSESVMFPAYDSLGKKDVLPAIDREAIQKLYGSNSKRPIPPKKATTQATKTVSTLDPPISGVTKWSRSSLTWSIHSFPKQITAARTTFIFRQAFDVWFEHIPLTITQTCSKCPADFVINFLSGDHNDGYPFDGPESVLSHTFFPEDGRIHFDADEDWTESVNGSGKNLYSVAIHDIGLALGLSHSFDSTSFIFPFYRVIQKRDELPQVDREAIRRLYGSVNQPLVSAGTVAIKPITPSSTTEKKHPRCEVFIDAALDYPDGSFHTLDEGTLWRYLPRKSMWDKQAKSYKGTYPRLPKQVTGGIYNSTARQVLIFTNTHVYQYQIEVFSNAARYLRSDRLPSHLRNAIVGAIHYLDEIYVVKKSTIESFSLDGNVKTAPRALKDEFPQFFGSVTTAFTHDNLHHFFTSDRRVYVWNETSDSWKTFGKPMDSNWFACSSGKTDDDDD